jgi:hypothetical protein
MSHASFDRWRAGMRLFSVSPSCCSPHQCIPWRSIPGGRHLGHPFTSRLLWCRAIWASQTPFSSATFFFLPLAGGFCPRLHGTSAIGFRWHGDSIAIRLLYNLEGRRRTAIWPLKSIGAPRNSEDCCLHSGRFQRNRLTCAFGPRRSFPAPVAATRLHQTAMQGRSRTDPTPGPADCKLLGLRLRKSCVPRVGQSKRRLTLCQAWLVQCRLDARAASGPGRPAPLLCQSKPSRAGVQSKPRGRELWRMGACGDRCPQLWLTAPGVALVPGVPPLGAQAPRHGRRGSLRVRTWSWSPGTVSHCCLFLGRALADVATRARVG